MRPQKLATRSPSIPPRGDSPSPHGVWAALAGLYTRARLTGNNSVSSEYLGSQSEQAAPTPKSRAVPGGPDMTAPAVGVNVLLERGYEQGDVVDELAAHGLIVQRVLRRLNVVSGNVAPDRLKELSEVTGVRAVEVDRTISAADARSEGLKPR